MHSLVSPLLLAVLICGLSISTATASGCPALEGTANVCVESAHGWFYAPTQDEAEAIAENARQAVESFQTYFGDQGTRGRGAVVSTGSGLGVSTEQTRVLEAAGAAWVLPWINSADKQRLARSQIRRQIQNQLGPNAEEELIERMVTKSLAQLPGSGADTANSALRHEIGHMLLISAFTPKGKAIAAHGYGGALADWMDETAAVLMESTAMTAARRQHFQQMLACGDESRLHTLAHFFVMDHPLAAVAQGLAAGEQHDGHDKGADGTRVRLLTGQAAEEYARVGVDFYTQARAVADFLMYSSSGNPVLFGSIAQVLAAGDSMEGWLTAQGSRYGLPGTLPDLEAQWEQWLQLARETAPVCKKQPDKA